MTESVWFLSEGSYSDYHVCGIFRTREDALAVKELLEQHLLGGRHQVEESVLLEPYVRDVAVLTLTTIIDTAGDEYPSEPRTYTDIEVGAPYGEAEPCSASVGPYGSGRTKQVDLACVELLVRGTDHERCRKVFSERRAQILSDPFGEAVRAWSGRNHTVESLARCGISASENERFVALVTDG